MERKPDYLLIADEDLSYGIKHKAYPEYSEDINSGKLLVLTVKEAKDQLELDKPEEDKLYYLNPYSLKYEDLASQNLDVNLCYAKAVEYREVLLKFGVYSAFVEEEIGDKKTSQYEGGVKVEKKSVKTDISSDYQKKTNLLANTKITIDEAERHPKTAEEIEEYVFSHGLRSDYNINAWLQRLKSDGRMSGSESIKITFLSELDSVFSSALGIKVLEDIEIAATFKLKKTHSREFSRTVKVVWSKPLQ